MSTPVSALTVAERIALEQQVENDWKTLSSTAIRAKKAQDPEYAAALERVLSGDFTQPESNESTIETPPAVDPNEPPVTPESNEEIIDPPPAPPVVPDEEPSGDPNLVRVGRGWEYRIDLGDGAGVQVFKGRTKDEVIAKLGIAQVNATKEIRRRNAENRVAKDFNPDELGLERNEASADVKPLTADEIYKLTGELQDPATARRAFQRLLEAEANDPTSTVGKRLNKADRLEAFESARGVSNQWVREHPDFYNVPENIETIQRYFIKHNLKVTAKNLDTVFNVLRSKSALLEAPAEEPEPQLPVSRADAQNEPPAVAVAPVPAAPAPPAPAKSTPPAATPRVRPGSASTGMSPRQASVRPGVTPNAPVGLTVEEYHRTPTSEIRRRYKTDLAFKAGVDKLIQEGKI